MTAKPPSFHNTGTLPAAITLWEGIPANDLPMTLHRPTHLPLFVTYISCLLVALVVSFTSVVTRADSLQNRILVLGDSISAGYGINPEAGWVALLDLRLGKDNSNSLSKWQVINASISGNTTGDGLARLPKLLATHHPKVVVIELGGNDGLRGHPLAQLRKNLNALIIQSEASGARVLLLGIEIPPNYGQRYTQEFRDSLQQVASERKVAFVPFILDKIALQPELMQNDGIHPKAEGQTQLLENIWPQLQKLLAAE